MPWVLLGLRAAPKEDSAVSSAEAVFGVPLAIPCQAQTEEKFEGQLPLIPLRKRTYAEAAGGRPSILEGVSHVYIRRGPVGGPLTNSYSGPYLVVERRLKTLLIQMGDRQEWVSADRVKPHAGGAPQVAQPPRRGRPLGTSGSG